MRSAVVLAFVCAACGLSVTGQEPANGSSDDAGTSPTSGGASSSSGASSASSSGGDVDALPVSCASLHDNPTVVRCLDFDDAPTDANHYGFDKLNPNDSPLSPTLSLEDSPLGAEAKKAFAMDFDPRDSAQKRELAATVAFPDFGARKYTHVSLDVDVAIDELVGSSVIAGLHFTGNGCNEFTGLYVNTSRELTHWLFTTKEKVPIGKYRLRAPFHVHLEADLGADGPKPLSLSIDGGTPHEFQVALPYPNCNVGEAWVGNYSASTGANESFHFRFDQVVLRGTVR